jgi:hypothetical protein
METQARVLIHTYEIRPRKDKHGVDLISDALPFGRLWYAEPDAISNAIGSAKFRSRSQNGTKSLQAARKVFTVL